MAAGVTIQQESSLKNVTGLFLRLDKWETQQKESFKSWDAQSRLTGCTLEYTLTNKEAIIAIHTQISEHYHYISIAYILVDDSC